jgi:hypothetical protein
MINTSDKSCTENKNTHFVSNNFFFPENRAVYEIKPENVGEPERPQVTVYYGARALHVG